MSAMKQGRKLIGLVGLVFGAVGAVREFRTAKDKNDRLALINAVVHVIRAEEEDDSTGVFVPANAPM